jgi:hypothetical protein
MAENLKFPRLALFNFDTSQAAQLSFALVHPSQGSYG